MISTRNTTCALTAIVTAAAIAGTVRRALADEECGAPEPGAEVVCTSANYDPDEDGNIYYAERVPDGDFSLRLDKGLAVTYHSGDPDDDTLVSELLPVGVLGRAHFSAVVAVPLDPAHAGDVTLTSSADVTATGYAARGYLAGRIGGSGGVALDLREGSIAAGATLPRQFGARLSAGKVFSATASGFGTRGPAISRSMPMAPRSTSSATMREASLPIISASATAWPRFAAAPSR